MRGRTRTNMVAMYLHTVFSRGMFDDGNARQRHGFAREEDDLSGGEEVQLCV